MNVLDFHTYVQLFITLLYLMKIVYLYQPNPVNF